MSKLIITSLIWAFSFSFIGVYLAGKVDSYIAISIRFILASIVLTPFLKISNYSKTFLFKIMGIGAIQIGLMYIFFYNSFLFLSVPEVILFTITTPLYIQIIGDFKEKKVRLASIIAIASSLLGAYLIKMHQVNPGFMQGFLMVQLCNICFALGQLLYKYTSRSESLRLGKRLDDKTYFAFFYYGATLFILPMLGFANFDKLPTSITQIGVLLWLGIIASGLGYLLWNSGARKVSHTKLATINNLIIPFGIVINYLLWNKMTGLTPFLFGSLFIIIPIILTKKEQNFD